MSGAGLLAPMLADLMQPIGGIFTVTYEVKNPLRRWWLRRRGWSTEWTVEYERRRIHEIIPRFAAARGEVEFHV